MVIALLHRHDWIGVIYYLFWWLVLFCLFYLCVVLHLSVFMVNAYNTPSWLEFSMLIRSTLRWFTVPQLFVVIIEPYLLPCSSTLPFAPLKEYVVNVYVDEEWAKLINGLSYARNSCIAYASIHEAGMMKPTYAIMLYINAKGRITYFMSGINGCAGGVCIMTSVVIFTCP